MAHDVDTSWLTDALNLSYIQWRTMEAEKHAPEKDKRSAYQDVTDRNKGAALGSGEDLACFFCDYDELYESDCSMCPGRNLWPVKADRMQDEGCVPCTAVGSAYRKSEVGLRPQPMIRFIEEVAVDMGVTLDDTKYNLPEALR